MRAAIIFDVMNEKVEFDGLKSFTNPHNGPSWTLQEQRILLYVQILVTLTCGYFEKTQLHRVEAISNFLGKRK
jgi:hypothetical protein